MSLDVKVHAVEKRAGYELRVISFTSDRGFGGLGSTNSINQHRKRRLIAVYQPNFSWCGGRMMSAASPTMPLSTGMRLGPYEILSPLGAGGMGEVYRARDTRLDRIVAIKILSSGGAAFEEVRQRFEREARAISRLNHPHICALHDIGRQDDINFLVIEYLEGETLAARLIKGRLMLDHALTYAIQIADALGHAHGRGVVHRDLKPGNVMITRSGAKLLDFGLAKIGALAAVAVREHTGRPTQTALTSAGTILGTFQYMAPEQLEGAEADARSDIFAFGATVYEVLTGRKAFEGKSRAKLISAIMSSQPPPISNFQPLATQALERVVGKCLAKDPEDRWQSARDLKTELTWIAGDTVSELSVRLAARALKRKRLAWIVAAGLFAAVIATWPINYLHPGSKTPVVEFEVTLGENMTPGFPAISPDGQYLAMDNADRGEFRIWLRALNSRAMIALPGTEGGAWPFWSPDSRQIGFSTKTALKKIRLAGGSPQTICNLPSGLATWNRDGEIIFSPHNVPGLYRVSAEGGEPRPLTTCDRSRQETHHAFPQFLPGGRRFIYLAVSSRPENTGTYLGSLDSSEVKRIHDGESYVVYAPPGFLIFNRGQHLMAQRFDIRRVQLSGEAMLLADSLAIMFVTFRRFSVCEGVLAYLPDFSSARTQLVWFDRTGRRLGTVAEPAQYSNAMISPNQKMVAVAKRDPQTKTRAIWVIDLRRGTSSRLTFNPTDDLNPAWSPDSTRIAFTSTRKGHRDIYVKSASGSGEEKLVLESNENKNVEHWSLDGQYLLYGGDPGIDDRLFLIGEHKSIPLPKFTQESRFCPSSGKAPRWIAYVSEETGAKQVYVRSFASALSGTGDTWQISTGGGSDPFWRGDGKELFYLNGNKLMAVKVKGDGESFQSGTPEQLFEAPLLSPSGRYRYDVTADGKRFLMNTQLEKERATFTVVLNWPGLLKR